MNGREKGEGGLRKGGKEWKRKDERKREEEMGKERRR